LANVGFVSALFFGLKAAVLAIVIEAVVRVGKRALKNNVMLSLAAAAFIAIFFFKAPFPLIVFAAGLIGYLGGRTGVQSFKIGGGHGPASSKDNADSKSLLDEQSSAYDRPSATQTLRVAGLWLTFWLVPVAALVFLLGQTNVFSQIALFFSKMAIVTFGGAYAVLAYVAQQAVESYHWLNPARCSMGLVWLRRRPAL
jgi:chromate transporter